MYGNGAMIGMILIIIKTVQRMILMAPHPAPAAFVAAGRGSAARRAAGWLVAATAAPAIASTSLAFVLPGLCKPLGAFTLLTFEKGVCLYGG